MMLQRRFEVMEWGILWVGFGLGLIGAAKKICRVFGAGSLGRGSLLLLVSRGEVLLGCFSTFFFTRTFLFFCGRASCMKGIAL